MKNLQILVRDLGCVTMQDIAVQIAKHTFDSLDKELNFFLDYIDLSADFSVYFEDDGNLHITSSHAGGSRVIWKPNENISKAIIYLRAYNYCALVINEFMQYKANRER